MNKRSILLISLCVVTCTYGVKAEELGGFFVEIEPGQSSQYPEQWNDQPQTSQESVEEEEEPVYHQPGEAIYEQNIERIPESQVSLPPVIYFYPPTPEASVDAQPYDFGYSESVLPTVTSVPTLIPAATPFSTPSPIPTETLIPTETPVPVPSVTPALVAKTAKELQDEKLEVCYFSTTIYEKEKALETVQIKIKSKYPVYVWSVRIDKQEQKWSWKKNQTIVVEDIKKERNYKLELLSFCEKKDKIQVFVDDKRK